jgi:hypothetical protein
MASQSSSLIRYNDEERQSRIEELEQLRKILDGLKPSQLGTRKVREPSG